MVRIDLGDRQDPPVRSLQQSPENGTDVPQAKPLTAPNTLRDWTFHIGQRVDVEVNEELLIPRCPFQRLPSRLLWVSLHLLKRDPPDATGADRFRFAFRNILDRMFAPDG